MILTLGTRHALVATFLLMGASAVCGQEALSPADQYPIIKAIKERDEQFINVRLKFRRFGQVKVNVSQERADVAFDDWRLGLTDSTELQSTLDAAETSQPAERDASLRAFEFSLEQTFTITATEIVSEQRHEPSPDKDHPLHNLVPYTKWSTVGDITKTISSGREGDQGVLLSPRDKYHGMRQRKWMIAEWLVGIGYAKRLAEVTKLQTESNGWTTIEGSLQIAERPDANCTLTVDADGIVRHAQVDSDVAILPGAAIAPLSLIITTSGTLSPDHGGPSIATQGSCQTIQHNTNGQIIDALSAINDNFNVEVIDYSGGIGDAEFARIAEITIPEYAHVSDPYHTIRFGAPPTPHFPMDWRLLFANGILIFGAVLYFLRQRRRNVTR